MSRAIESRVGEITFSAGTPCVCSRSSGGPPIPDGEPSAGYPNDNWDTIREIDKGGNNNTTEETKVNPFDKFTKNEGGDNDNNVIGSDETPTVPPKSFSDPLTIPNVAAKAIKSTKKTKKQFSPPFNNCHWY